MDVNLIGDGNRRPRKSRDALILDQLHKIRVAAARLVADRCMVDDTPSFCTLSDEIAAFDQIDRETRG